MMYGDSLRGRRTLGGAVLALGLSAATVATAAPAHRRPVNTQDGHGHFTMTADARVRSQQGEFSARGQDNPLRDSRNDHERGASRNISVPPAARDYRPPMTPPPHPRLLVNPDALTQIRANLERGENRAVWERLSRVARAPFRFDPPPDQEVVYDKAVAEAISAKAFYFLVRGDRAVGREAVELALAYLERVNFGKGQDICRPIGEIIYRSSQVYDWCYPLMTPEERTRMRAKMRRWAGAMEIGWPPFRQSVINGHGNEAQVSRDLFSMALAVYDEDPEPYRYIMYHMLEVLKPAKEYLYRSGRHDQGTGYGSYRYMWDLFAALQFRRTFGYELLPTAASAGVPYYWHYRRTPDNRFLIEGDDNWSWSNRHMSNAQMLLGHLALWPDPELKEELRRYNPLLDFPEDPVWFLLVNDPGLKPEDRRAALPLTRYYGKPLPGMIARTGWNFSRLADDAVVAMTGADYHYRNHQHLDMGSFQIYYRGNLAADLGQYQTYGNAFDWNFAKSAVSHSVMLFRDPAQAGYGMGSQFSVNTGTQEIPGWWPPNSHAEMMRDGKFRNGDTMRAGWGPVHEKPLYSFMETDLGVLYPGRVKSYSRSFVFLNLGLPETPAALLVLDRFRKSHSRVEPVFQLVSVALPALKNDTLEVVTAPYGPSGKIAVQTLLPARAGKKILSGKSAFTVGGQYFAPRTGVPEAEGSRTEITGDGETFLHAILIQDGKALPMPVVHRERDGRIEVALADRLVNFGDALVPTGRAVAWRVATAGTQVLLLDLAPGVWELSRDGRMVGRSDVLGADGGFFAILEPGDYRLTPVSGSKAPPLPPSRVAAVITPPPRANQVFRDGQRWDGVFGVPDDAGRLRLPLSKFFPSGLEDGGRTLRFLFRGRPITLKAGDRVVKIGDETIPLAQPVTAGDFLLPGPLAAGFAGYALDEEPGTGMAFLHRIPLSGNVLAITGGDDTGRFWRMWNGEGEWASFGRRVPVDVRLLEPVMLEKVAIKWTRGMIRQSSFRLEVSTDGTHFETVFDGASSGRSADYEAVAFARREVRALRFLFRGNHVGEWNHVSGIRLE